MTGFISPKWMREFGTGGYLFWGLRSLLGVTKADQGDTSTITGRMVNKVDQGTKSRSGPIEFPGISNLVKTGNTDQKKVPPVTNGAKKRPKTIAK